VRVCEDDEERMRTRNDRDGKLTVIWCGMNFIEPFLLVDPAPKPTFFMASIIFILLLIIHMCVFGELCGPSLAFHSRHHPSNLLPPKAAAEDNYSLFLVCF